METQRQTEVEADTDLGRGPGCKIQNAKKDKWLPPDGITIISVVTLLNTFQRLEWFKDVMANINNVLMKPSKHSRRSFLRIICMTLCNSK